MGRFDATRGAATLTAGEGGGAEAGPGNSRARARADLAALKARALAQMGGVSGPAAPPPAGSRPTAPRQPAQAPGAAQAAAPPELPDPLEAFAAVAAARIPCLVRDRETVGLPAFRVDRDALPDVCRRLRDAEGLSLDYLACCSAVDYEDRIDVVYHCYSVRHPGRGLALKVAAPKERPGAADPALPWLPSVTGVWPGAEWHEREIFDLFGVTFRGHPDLRRILMPEGFDGGYPLRKDYVDRREQRERKVRPR